MTSTPMKNTHRNLLRPLFAILALVLAVVLTATPVLAQGQGKKKGHAKHDEDKHQGRHVVVQVDDDDSDSDSDSHRRDNRVEIVDDDSDALYADGRRNRVVARGAGTSIIALGARITDLDTGRVQTLDFDGPADHARVQVGDSVRVELIGTAIVDGNGVAVRVPADFDVAAGSWRLDIEPTRAANAVIVHARQPNSAYRGNPQGRSGLAYTVRGDYEMKPRLANGRITFEIADAAGDFGPGSQPGTPTQPWKQGARWQHAAAIADALDTIDFTDDFTDDDVAQIYERGMVGIRTLAGGEVRDIGNALSGRSAEAALAHAYQYLLGRRGDAQAMLRADPQGFRSNLDQLRRRGYGAIVMQFVNSDEFRVHHDIDAFEDLPLSTETGSRVVLDEDGHRVVVRDTRPN